MRLQLLLTWPDMTPLTGLCICNEAPSQAYCCKVRSAWQGNASHAVVLQVISTALGYVLPNLISREATQHAATVLYTFFGLRLYWIAWRARQEDSTQVSRALDKDCAGYCFLVL